MMSYLKCPLGGRESPGSTGVLTDFLGSAVSTGGSFVSTTVCVVSTSALSLSLLALSGRGKAVDFVEGHLLVGAETMPFYFAIGGDEVGILVRIEFVSVHVPV